MANDRDNPKKMSVFDPATGLILCAPLFFLLVIQAISLEQHWGFFVPGFPFIEFDAYEDKIAVAVYDSVGRSYSGSIGEGYPAEYFSLGFSTGKDGINSRRYWCLNLPILGIMVMTVALTILLSMVHRSPFTRQ